MLEIKDCRVGYGTGVGRTEILHGVSLEARNGEVLAIIGPNGCGKTTLLKTIARLLPYTGAIRVDGEEIGSFSRKALSRKIALLGQSAQVYFPYSVRDTVALGRFPYSKGFFNTTTQEDEEIVDSVLARLGLDDIRGRMITEISGGQLQRVFLARTLAQTPDLILLDEPTNHLDLKHQVELLGYLSSWARETGKTVVAVLHDLNLARRFGDKIALLSDGRLAASGPPETALASPLLEEIYGIDIRAFMLDSLERWRETAGP